MLPKVVLKYFAFGNDVCQGGGLGAKLPAAGKILASFSKNYAFQRSFLIKFINNLF